MSQTAPSSEQRRSFLSRLRLGGAALAALALQRPAQAAARRFQAAKHDKDRWLDELPGKHRLVFDTTTIESFGEAMLFANNFILANKTGYGLENKDVAVVIVARHMSTPFAYSDGMWAKYGAVMTRRAPAVDPQTKQPPAVNLFNSNESSRGQKNFGVTIPRLAEQGVHFAVCGMATQGLADMIAKEVQAEPGSIFKELTSNLVANSHVAAAGIVAVSRAQEYGYTFVSA